MEPSSIHLSQPQSSNPDSGLVRLVEDIQHQIGRVIVGQHAMIELLLAGLLADGHILLEGVPGVAKTLTAKLLSKLINARFSRIQFTPDLMPSDVLGTSVFNPQQAEFTFKPGPVFSNMVLIDEINRAPAKTQAALFEVMEERQVTVDGRTYPMAPPFMVLATQNPIEQEGTYRLPEAQLDRFLMKIVIGYPSLEEEVKILEMHHGANAGDLLADIQPMVTTEALADARAQIAKLHVEPKLVQFIARLTHETRNNAGLYLGASPRASIALLKTAKSMAVLRGRTFVIPEDVLEVAGPVLRHRIALSPEKEMEGSTTDEVVKEIIAKLEIPR